MELRNKATRIDLFSFSTPQMRAFHLSWAAFFTVFFAWFGIAPLMPIVREDLGLTNAQIGNTVIGSVAVTVLVRILIGPLCDRFGARLTYTGLLVLGSLPVMAIGLSQSYESFLLFRVAIGAIGAAFVITQYHTSVMFAPNCVGTANATTAGWGNLGGGVTQIVMPLVLAGFLVLGVSESVGWRLAMVVPGAVLLVMGIGYYLLTQDAPDGNYRELRARGLLPSASRSLGTASFVEAARDPRVWALFVIYALCFGVELTINNVAALYFHDRFELDVRTAGLVAGLFGLMNLFARTLGGYVSDRSALKWGLNGRVRLLFVVLLAEGLALILFSRMGIFPLAVATMLIFSLFVQMAEGATYGLVPFVNRRVLGAVAGIVGAGGNAGAVAAGFLFRVESLSFQGSFLVLGFAVTAASFVALTIRFRTEPREAEVAALDADSAQPAGADGRASLATGLAVAGRGSD
jgi:MFS transporter, NNP family, nitrate/nitrite transporter